ncbi:hypothetical protein GCM10027033_12400 [Leucobacter ruminantium]
MLAVPPDMLLAANRRDRGAQRRLGFGAAGAGTLGRMSKTRTAWITYIVLRLLLFAVPFGVLYMIGLQPWLAAVFAALIGAALSILLLSKQRATASESIYDWRNRTRTADDIVEDEAVDAADSPDGETGRA